MQLADVNRIYKPNEIIEKKTFNERTYTREERKKVINDCIRMNGKQKDEYAKKHGYTRQTINYFIYQYRAGAR